MKITELKTGMWIEKLNGKIGMVLLGTEHGDIISGETWNPLYNIPFEDLDNQNPNSAYAIKRIYHPRNVCSYLNEFPKIALSDMDLVWEYNPHKKEIEEIKAEIIKLENRLIELQNSK